MGIKKKESLMANWSSISIDFKGNIEKLGITKDIIIDELEIEVDDLIVKDDEDSFVFGSARWSTDILKISEFADKYSLTFVFQESEPGCDYYTKITYEDGIEIDLIETEYFSVESIDYHGLDSFVDNLFYCDEVNRHIYNILEEVGELDDEIKKKALKLLMEAKNED